MTPVPWSHIRFYPPTEGVVYNYNPSPGNPRTSCGCMHGSPAGALACGQWRGAGAKVYNAIERLYLDGTGRRVTFPIEPRPKDFQYTDFLRNPPYSGDLPEPTPQS